LAGAILPSKKNSKKNLQEGGELRRKKKETESDAQKRKVQMTEER